MIISQTPYRISFFGGGSDYPTWYKEYGGEVLSTTIDKYLYLSIRELPLFFKHNYRIVYSKIETAKNVNEIKFNVITKKPILPTKIEISNNNRASSAKLRIAERIA